MEYEIKDEIKDEIKEPIWHLDPHEKCSSPTVNKLVPSAQSLLNESPSLFSKPSGVNQRVITIGRPISKISSHYVKDGGSLHLLYENGSPLAVNVRGMYIHNPSRCATECKGNDSWYTGIHFYEEVKRLELPFDLSSIIDVEFPRHIIPKTTGFYGGKILLAMFDQTYHDFIGYKEYIKRSKSLCGIVIEIYEIDNKEQRRDWRLDNEYILSPTEFTSSLTLEKIDPPVYEKRHLERDLTIPKWLTRESILSHDLILHGPTKYERRKPRPYDKEVETGRLYQIFQHGDPLVITGKGKYVPCYGKGPRVRGFHLYDQDKWYPDYRFAREIQKFNFPKSLLRIFNGTWVPKSRDSLKDKVSDETEIHLEFPDEIRIPTGTDYYHGTIKLFILARNFWGKEECSLHGQVAEWRKIPRNEVYE